MHLRLSFLAFAVALAACSPTAPTNRENVSKVTSASGATITSVESRRAIPSGELAGTEAAIAEVTAKVAAVDIEKRWLSLKTKDGRTVEMTVGPEVRNLTQIKVGDTVELVYMQAIDFQVRKPTAEEIARSNQGAGFVARAPKGSKPFGLAAASETSIFTIAAIDTSNSMVSLRDGERLVTVKAKYPENLKLVKEGDSVVVTVSEYVVAQVKPVA